MGRREEEKEEERTRFEFPIAESKSNFMAPMPK